MEIYVSGLNETKGWTKVFKVKCGVIAFRHAFKVASDFLFVSVMRMYDKKTFKRTRLKKVPFQNVLILFLMLVKRSVNNEVKDWIYFLWIYLVFLIIIQENSVGLACQFQMESMDFATTLEG